MALQNPWIQYIDRSYQQIKAAVLSKVAVLIPEMTDQTEGNIFVKMISIWSGIAEMIGYYVDVNARESFLFTARRFKSAIKHARANSYRVKGGTAASVDYKFSIQQVAGSDITFPANTEVGTTDNISFFTTSLVKILAGQLFVNVPVVQKQTTTGTIIATSDGTPDQEYELPEGVADGSVACIIQSIQWEPEDAFTFSVGSSRHFIAGINENQRMSIRFGDGVNGLIPPAGAQIILNYGITQGALGNVGSNTITEIVSIITLPPGVVLSGANALGASGGSDLEDIPRIRKNIALNNRANDRAVGPGDYAAIAELAPGVEKAGEIYNFGKIVEVYISPIGGGLASTQLLNDTDYYLRSRKMITTDVFLFAAGEVGIIIVASVNVLPNYERSVVGPAVKAALSAFGSTANQKIGGGMQLSDIYQTIENTPGVDNSNITVFTTKPYARPISHQHQLNWTRSTLAGSVDTVKWRLVYTGGTAFQVLRNGSYIGIINTGDTVTYDEISFVVGAGTYSVSDSWEFVTYNYFGTVQLSEPSTPTIAVDDITLTLNGGI